ncbi:hypothetical protein D9611_005274 [Ephemerocybe angulata]|uniref:Uncharacterized protein n=1 Tax=Ephemerocybe angulata TaxID=980116 RepID=A0A8H5FDN0_9AGAR|nr:hypothetical protein D9611_005274 [Tulosesus angulatus]
MDRCLQIHEIIQNICAHAADKRSLLHMALSSRRFLAPALDALWHDIDSLLPLITCLKSTNDLWDTEDPVPHPLYEGELVAVLHPIRAITREDLERYTDFYAPRIRIFRPSVLEKEILSIEAFQALQLATEGRNGALAPLVKTLEWPSPRHLSGELEERFARLLSPYMLLFYGNDITSLTFNLPPDIPLHKGSLELALKRSSRNLKALAIEQRAEPTEDPIFILQCICVHNLDLLESLQLPFLADELVQPVASLPSLKTLIIADCGVNGGYSVLSPISGGLAKKVAGSPAFPCLECLKVDGAHITYLPGLLACFPSANAIASLEFTVRFWNLDPITLSEAQKLIDAIVLHCNPLTLTSIQLLDQIAHNQVEEPVVVDIRDELDLSGLFKFTNIAQLSVQVQPAIMITPEDIARIPLAFPKIRTLSLCGRVPNYHPPRINHIHFLSLLQNCPFLTHLGLKFDLATVEGIGSPGAPFRLETVSVGDSPMYLPSEVISFFRYNLPNLRSLAFAIPKNPTVLARRWDLVCEGLGVDNPHRYFNYNLTNLTSYM